MLEDIGGGGKRNRLGTRGPPSWTFQVDDMANIGVDFYGFEGADHEYRS